MNHFCPLWNVSSDSFLFRVEVVLHLPFHNLLTKFKMHESNIISCKISCFPQLILQLEPDCWFGSFLCFGRLFAI